MHNIFFPLLILGTIGYSYSKWHFTGLLYSVPIIVLLLFLWDWVADAVFHLEADDKVEEAWTEDDVV